ncbi:MAG: DUF1249 domain-containing protein [Gammaproteobacteria bacterium]
MSLYETNYQRLMRFIPDLTLLQKNTCLSVNGNAELVLEVLDRSKYTTTISIKHVINTEDQIVDDMVICVRVYHDVKLVECIAYQNETRFFPFYTYPNKKMRQPFEKRQVNLFFGEWLQLCLTHGYRFDIEIDYTSV